MFNLRKFSINANRLNDGMICIKGYPITQFHNTSMCPGYAATAILPIPNNIDVTETTRFSPQRTRDINANVIHSQYNDLGASTAARIDITTDNSYVSAMSNATQTQAQDPHVQSYDCFGAVSLNSVMQSNVPTPFGGSHKFTHLNMPGGQWSQEGKFMSQSLHSSHYRALRDNARSGWLAYDQNATIQKQEHATNWNGQQKRHYCTSKLNADENPKPQTKKEQLKKAFKEYGATVVIFHVAISLASLGGCYVLVSGGIDLMPIVDYLGLSSSSLSNKIAAGASTFVVAYAIHKVFAPVRISITLGATPFIVRFLRSKGILKQNIKDK